MDVTWTCNLNLGKLIPGMVKEGWGACMHRPLGVIWKNDQGHNIALITISFHIYKHLNKIHYII